MPELGGWRPAKQAHSISNANVSVTFAQAVGDVAWRRIDKEIGALAVAKGLSERQSVGLAGLPAPILAFVQNASGGMQPETGALYQRREGPELVPEKLQLAPNSVGYDQGEYVRWVPMKERFRELGALAIQEYGAVAPISMVSVSYVDVFTAADPTIDNDISAIIDPEGAAVARLAFKSNALWHSHCGWFDYPDAHTRRLTNIFIDIEQQFTLPDRPHTIRIRTLQQDQFGQPGQQRLPDKSLDWSFLEDRFDALHEGLKGMLSAILTPAAAQMIALD